MSLFSSMTRIEGGQYQHVPAQPKDYGASALLRAWFRDLWRDLNAVTHPCAQSPEDQQEDSDVRMTLAKYQAFLKKMEQSLVRGERKRER